ncbi:hypothetical protein [Curtobacterium sp. VKM Ac-1376]|uniref:hypothetical protein n=1 Tax=Curtobacterium sp. VKM Ac-1376 TaxID=123312 RepID=UPI00188BEC8D|nr:hypothetical protein [Curtobacterium sp. VKM Ac-1376]MBF4616411.1 hypothetical protein [Curtobacterium sp. VKM Ac-1376]
MTRTLADTQAALRALLDDDTLITDRAWQETPTSWIPGWAGRELYDTGSPLHVSVGGLGLVVPKNEHNDPYIVRSGEALEDGLAAHGDTGPVVEHGMSPVVRWAKWDADPVLRRPAPPLTSAAVNPSV